MDRPAERPEDGDDAESAIVPPEPRVSPEPRDELLAAAEIPLVTEDMVVGALNRLNAGDDRLEVSAATGLSIRELEQAQYGFRVSMDFAFGETVWRLNEARREAKR